MVHIRPHLFTKKPTYSNNSPRKVAIRQKTLKNSIGKITICILNSS